MSVLSLSLGFFFDVCVVLLTRDSFRLCYFVFSVNNNNNNTNVCKEHIVSIRASF